MNFFVYLKIKKISKSIQLALIIFWLSVCLLIILFTASAVSNFVGFSATLQTPGYIEVGEGETIVFDVVYTNVAPETGGQETYYISVA